MRKEKKRGAAELHLHSDQGFQYTSQAYFDLTKSYGITPSMSMIDRYIDFYNHERIQLKTGVAPLTLRHSA